jgi:hypothetical protein
MADNRKLASRVLWAGSVVLAIGAAAYYVLSQQDHIRLVGTAGSDSPTIVVNANRGGTCIVDEAERGTDPAVGNLIPMGSCTSEVVVYAQDNAVQFDTPVTSWTNAATDVLPIPMSGLISVPLTVWLMTGGPNDPIVNTSRANQIYNTMQTGLVFVPDVRDVRASASGFSSVSCDTLSTLKESFPPVPSQLNLYYAPTVLSTTTTSSGPVTYEVNGKWCQNDPNIVLIGAFVPETQTHEIGHAFTLLHTDMVLPSNNVMFSQPTTRDSFTTGQAFRININPDSALNLNHTRSGSTRPCPDSLTSVLCPNLVFDVVPK